MPFTLQQQKDIEEKVKRSSLPFLKPVCTGSIMQVNYGSQVMMVIQRINDKSFQLSEYNFLQSAVLPVKNWVRWNMILHRMDLLVVEIKKRWRKNPYQDLTLPFLTRFKQIYEQAEICMESNLDEVTGMAYGKAHEILICDYIIDQHPDSKDMFGDGKIRLKSIMEKYGFPKDICDHCEQIFWLRNDHMHLIKRHPDFTIEDMKAKIHTTVRWIELDYELKNQKQVNRAANV